VFLSLPGVGALWAGDVVVGWRRWGGGDGRGGCDGGEHFRRRWAEESGEAWWGLLVRTLQLLTHELEEQDKYTTLTPV